MDQIHSIALGKSTVSSLWRNHIFHCNSISIYVKISIYSGQDNLIWNVSLNTSTYHFFALDVRIIEHDLYFITLIILIYQ